jgi:hypothetical protein
MASTRRGDPESQLKVTSKPPSGNEICLPKNAGVDCVTVGYKNTTEIDEAIDNLNLALA